MLKAIDLTTLIVQIANHFREKLIDRFNRDVDYRALTHALQGVLQVYNK